MEGYTSRLMAPGMAPFVSVVVPVFDDRAALESLLTWLRPGPEVEVIVAHAGPMDPAMTAHLHQLNVRWAMSAPGRALQMNTGAREAAGRWLLFLHADCRLDAGWIEQLRLAEAIPDEVGGSFRFTLDSPRIVARVLERAVSLRVRWLDLPYGDQALFVRRDVFEAMGGYAVMPLMEDVEMVRRLRRLGRLRHSTTPVRTSARRWERDGWINRSARNILIASLYFLGVSPDRLARIYNNSASRAGASSTSRETTTAHGTAPR